MNRDAKSDPQYWRRLFIFVLLGGAVAIVAARAVMLHLFPEVVSARLPDRASQQHIGEMLIPARRGEIVDRKGAVLAMSTPMVTVGCNPRLFPEDKALRKSLAKLLGQPESWLRKKLKRYAERY